MKLEGSEERALWKETVVSQLRGVLTAATFPITNHDMQQAAAAAITVADHVALAFRERDTSRPK